MNYQSGDIVYVEFTTRSFSTGAGVNADSLPGGTLNRNGSDDGGVTVTVTNIDTGRYKASFTIPTTYIPGDVLNLSIAATVGGTADKAIVWNQKIGVGLIRSNTAQAGAAGTITLDSSASSTDNFYTGTWIVIVAGTGAGQCRFCTNYVGSTKVASVAPNWITNPSSSSVFAILPIGGVDIEAINNNATAAVLQSLAAKAIYSGSITNASPTTTTFVDSAQTGGDDDWWKGRVIYFMGTCAGQMATITGYNHTTKTYTYSAITRAPAQNDTYLIF